MFPLYMSYVSPIYLVFNIGDYRRHNRERTEKRLFVHVPKALYNFIIIGIDISHVLSSYGFWNDTFKPTSSFAFLVEFIKIVPEEAFF